MFDFTNFAIKMSSANSSQLYFPLKWSGSGIRVVLEGRISFKCSKLQYTGQAETEHSVDSQSQDIL